MASIGPLAARSLLGNHAAPLRAVQRRWAQVHDVRFVATHQDANRVLDRYKDKLDRKARDEGHSSVSSLREAYQDKINATRASELKPPPYPASRTSPSSTHEKSLPTSSSVSTDKSGNNDNIPSNHQSVTPGIKPLSAYLDIPKILALPPKEIEALWRLRHAANPLSICATIPLETYRRIANTARHHPQFILPLPRPAADPSTTSTSERNATGNAPSSATAADIHFLQWAFHPPTSSSAQQGAQNTAKTHTSTILFTQLASYKLHGAYAQPHTTITHHLDLADEKGLVMMNGSVVADRGVTVDEARWLVMWLQRFYDWGVRGDEGGRKGEMLRMFTRGDSGFNVEDLMEEVKRV